MSQSCTVCRSPRLKEVDDAILSKVPVRHIAEQFGLSATSVQSHKKCNGSALARTAVVLADRRGETLAEEIRRKKTEAEELQATATRDGDPRTALVAIKVYADLVKLLLDAAALAASGPDEVEVILQVGVE